MTAINHEPHEIMRAFHGDPNIKAKYLARVRAHRQADELIQGATEGRMENGEFRGCAVVCTLERYDHEGYETELGIPRQLARLEDGIFERIRDEYHLQWPEDFLAAIQVGADLGMVTDRFLHWLLVDSDHGVIRYAKGDALAAIKRVAVLYVRRLAGDDPPLEEWKAASSAAASAAASSSAAAAYAAASAADAADYASAAATYAAAAADAAASAAASAADAADYASAAAAYAAASAASAADSAASAADCDAYAAARAAVCRVQAAKLLELLRAAPVVEMEVAAP